MQKTDLQTETETQEVPAVEVKKQVREKNIFRVRGMPDIPLLVIILILVGFGLAMVYSASYPWAENDYGNSYYYVQRQLIFTGLGGLAMFALASVDYKIYMKWGAPVFFAISFLLLLSVPIIGKSVNGAKRWIDLGIFRFQPTDIMKLALVMMLAWYISRYVDAYRDLDERTIALKNKRLHKRKFKESFPVFLREVFIPLCIVGLVCAVTLVEKHLSGTIILFLIGWIVMLWGRISLPWLLGIIGAGGAGALAIATLTDYTSDRLAVWLDPYSDPLGSGWQVIQSFNAIGSGGLFGVGFTNSTLKHLYLPEPQNDFIFAIVCEEFGFVGAIGLMIIFGLFVWRGILISLRAPDCFSRLLAAGITCKIAVQVLLNIFVVTGLFPPTGISMPFISYGGTALIILMAECGILLCISRFSAEKKI
ncbi:MAG: cell division protein FtsW [Clostridia bacterium]|jgi:cell division protein FtsW|nr:cell division protein FtsW [Clostridia bacterium]